MDVLVVIGLSMIALILLGAPIAFAMLVFGVGGLLLTFGEVATMGVLEIVPYGKTQNYTLAAVPMFVLMAELMRGGNMASAIFDCLHKFVGHLRGGLAVATIFANAVFGALCGSSVASAAMMSSIAVPEMRRYGYDDRLSLGCVACAGTLAIMIPPSLGLILYGIITETSIGKLLIAGIVPGVLTAIGYMLMVRLWVGVNPEIAKSSATRASWREKRASLVPVLPAFMLMFVILGGIYTGAITPTEAAGVGAAGALIAGLAQGFIKRKDFATTLSSTIRTTAMLFMIVIAAMVFNYFIASTQAPALLTSYIRSLDLEPWMVLLILVAMYLVLGFFMDQIAILFLTLPLTFPIVVDLGYDPVWFGIIIVKTSEIGLVTPPLGLNAYVAAGAVGARVETAFRGIWPLVAVDMALLIAFIAFPGVVLFLPGSMD